MSIDHLLPQYLRYDPETGKLFWIKKSGPAVVVGAEAGGIMQNGYMKVAVLGQQMLSHRLAWFLTHGVWPADQIDHINNVRDDNRLCNLRLATESQNKQNRRPVPGRTTPVGVQFKKGAYEASIKANGTSYYLGRFARLEDAAAVRSAAAQRLHGEFARPE